MTYLPSEEERKAWNRVSEWYHFDQRGNLVIREDAPDEIKRLAQKLEEKDKWHIE